jgi:hypothetical protein
MKMMWGIAAAAVALVVSGAAHGQRKAGAQPIARTAAKSAAVPAPVLPDFTFKEAKAGETVDPAVVGKCSPTRDGIAGKIECRGSDAVVAGVRLILAPNYYFYNNRLTSMLFLYDNNGTNFLTFLGAFQDKYGKPCSTSADKWQNRAGSTFDNDTATWCFKTGKLKLERLGPSLKYGVVAYTDDVSAPSADTPKDF